MDLNYLLQNEHLIFSGIVLSGLLIEALEHLDLAFRELWVFSLVTELNDSES